MKLLENSKKVEIFEPNNLSEYNPHRVIVFVKNAEKTLLKLNKNGIGARSMFHPMHLQPIYKTSGDFINTEHIFAHGICLPSAPTLKEKNIGYIVSLLEEFA